MCVARGFKARATEVEGSALVDRAAGHGAVDMWATTSTDS
jgi:hypothetical protein